MPSLTNKKKGMDNIEKLIKYIKSTPLKNIPRNQYGSASQKKILESLNIATSNRNSSPIKSAFNKLNEELCFQPLYPRENIPHNEVKKLKTVISKLQNRIALLTAENDELNSRLLCEDWFVETGRMVRFND